ncbi:MAG: tetratricopeptide repeat protein [Planctomycetota bacterium]|jgi:tetratricopeptide (TPR) repeat protein
MGHACRAALWLLICLPIVCVAAPGEPSRLNEEGIALLQGRRTAEAAEKFETALASRPGDVNLKRNLAAALAARADERRRAKEPAEAVELLDRSVRLHPERLRYRLLRGRARYQAGRSADRFFAREDFRFVLERDPDHLAALVNLGQLSYMERRLEEAVELWRHALELRPSDSDIRARLDRAERELAVERSYDELRAAKFLVRFGPSIPRTVAETVLTLCETAYDELCARFQHWPDRVTVVSLYSPAEFRSATRLHAWVAGLSDGTLRLTVRADSSRTALRAMVYHEYAHHLIRGIASRVPAWLHEGLAQMAEGRSVAAAEARLRKAGALEPDDLSERILAQSDPRRVTRFYDMALSFTEYLRQQGGGDRGIHDLLRGLNDGVGEQRAIKGAFGLSRDELFSRWRMQLRPR